DARRGSKNIAEKIQRLWVAARGDLAHVPDRGALRVEIRRHHVKAASRPVLACDRVKQFRVDMSRDQVPQGGGLEESRTEQSRQSIRLQQVCHLAAGED